MAENIVQTNLLQQHNQDYTMFAIEIIRHRMLPSPLDGLKPVHRRILYALFHDIKAKTPNARTVKTARVIGEVIGKYHPHGDASVNDAIKLVAKDRNVAKNEIYREVKLFPGT